MSHATVLFQSDGSVNWTKLRTVVFDSRRGTIENITLGSHTIELNHNPQGHALLLTDENTRVVLSPTGGNELEEEGEKMMFGDIPIVSHYDIKEGQKTYRLYHQRHQGERW